MEHNLFKPKSFEEGRHGVVGDCNGFTMQQRWNSETPAFARKIVELVKIGPEDFSVLDYGCGVGRLAKEILEIRKDIILVGVDESGDMLAQAVQYINNDNFIQMFPKDLDGTDMAFDVAYCVYVLQHVPAIYIREILSRIYNHLKDDGYFIYCSSDYRMCIRYDGKGFFDDRFLGVDLQAEVERYFDKVGPLFNEEDYKDNPILRKMITGEPNGLAHPAFIYKKKKISPHIITSMEQTEIKPKEQKLPKKLLLINRLSPGDILVMTNAIRDLHLAYPGKFITDVRTPANDIFFNNPYITKLIYNEKEYNDINIWFQSNVGKTKMLGDIMVIDMQYPLIHQSGARGAHFAEGHREFLEEVLKIKIPQTKLRPDLYLSDIEINKPTPGKYWIINAGNKGDYTLKQYPYYQEVVNLLKGKIQFVQIGLKSHNHKPLEGVIDMIGQTNNRDLFRLIYHAEGVLTCVSLPMHVAAAFKKPCVVVAGAREGTRWELYPNHRFIYVNGCLPCADYDGCWRSKVKECDNKKNDIPLCMTLIKPEEVVREIEKYYEGGILKYGKMEPVIFSQQKKEINMINIKESIYEPIPLECISPIANSAIFNTLRILKQINPNDTYLEAYQWHYNKHKETFMDVYHFLWYLGSVIKPKRILEIGTRTGISICQLLSAYLNYNELEKIILCDIFSDNISTPAVVIGNLKYLNIPTDKIQFIIGNSLEEIPKLIGKDTFDYILVDGCHDKDFARKDLKNVVQLIEIGGYIVFDDITPDGCSLMDIWEEFKEFNKDNFIYMENLDGKGLGIAKREK